MTENTNPELDKLRQAMAYDRAIAAQGLAYRARRLAIKSMIVACASAAICSLMGASIAYWLFR